MLSKASTMSFPELVSCASGLQAGGDAPQRNWHSAELQNGRGPAEASGAALTKGGNQKSESKCLLSSFKFL